MSEDPDLVSIVIPVFNGSRYLAEAIDSALAQSWPSIEVIVVDDGSDDGGATRRVVSGYGGRVRYFGKANGGVGSALNAGIARMRGRWFSWLSHDDRYHPHKIERQMAALRQGRTPAIVFCDYDAIDEDGRFLHHMSVGKGWEGAHALWTVFETRLNGCTLLVPRVCFDVCGRFDETLPTTQDYALWFEMARRFPFIHVPEALVAHRRHAGQGSRTASHIAEANLLWLTMVDRLSPDEMRSAAGTETRFLIRALGHLRRGPMAGARGHLEQRLAARLARMRVALVWCDDGAGEGPGVAIGRIEQAGPRVSAIVVLDRSPSAERSLVVRQRRWPRPVTLVRVRPGATVRELVSAAAGHVRAPFAVLATPASTPAAASIQAGLEHILLDGIEVWLPPGGPPERWPDVAPEAVAGAVLTRRALTRIFSGTGTRDAVRAIAVRVAPDESVRPDEVTGDTRAGPAPERRLRTAAAMHGTDRPTLLIVLHGIGGGTVRYAQTVAALARSRVEVLFAWGIDNRTLRISADIENDPGLSFDLPSGIDAAARALTSRGLARVDVMHTMGLEEHIDALLDHLGVPFDTTILDYHGLAHTPHFWDARRGFVGNEALDDPNHPMRRRGPLPVTLRRAERRIAISRDVAARMARLTPGLAFIAAHPPEPVRIDRFQPPPPRLRDGERLRVLFLGAFAPFKGAGTVMEVAAAAVRERAPLDFHVLGGWAALPPADRQCGVVFHGRYREDRLDELVCRIRPHLAWLPFAVPETYSFVVSDAVRNGLPILSVATGAVTERLAGRPYTWLLDPSATPRTHLDWLVRLHAAKLELPPQWPSTAHLPPLADGFYEDDYLAPLTGSTAPRPT